MLVVPSCFAACAGWQKQSLGFDEGSPCDSRLMYTFSLRTRDGHIAQTHMFWIFSVSGLFLCSPSAVQKERGEHVLSKMVHRCLVLTVTLTVQCTVRVGVVVSRFTFEGLQSMYRLANRWKTSGCSILNLDRSDCTPIKGGLLGT